MSARQGGGDERGVRLDKWLWAARFYKTRQLAIDDLGRGRIAVNGGVAKPAREVRVDDRIELRQASLTRTIDVVAVSGVRRSAPEAATLYRETAESVAAREAYAIARREAMATSLGSKPSRRDRQHLAEWTRWSAAIDDD